MSDVFVNGLVLQLTAGCTATDPTVTATVVGGTLPTLAAGQQIRLVAADTGEILALTGNPTGAAFPVSRGLEGTVAAAHKQLVLLAAALTKAHVDGLVAADVARCVARGAWAATTVYAVNDVVIAYGTAWRCLVAHTSAATFTGESAGRWERWGIPVSATAPPNPVAGDPWYDLGTDLLKRWSGSAWVAAGSATFTPRLSTPSSPVRAPLAVDYDMTVRATLGSVDILRYTEPQRRRVVIVNNGTDTLNVAQGTLNSTTAPGSGYSAVAVGQQWESYDPLPVFGYFTTTSQTARVYVELEA